MVRRIAHNSRSGTADGDGLAFYCTRQEASSTVFQAADDPGSSGKSTPVTSVSSEERFHAWHFLQLAFLTGFLAAVASVLGKIACDFGPGALLQPLSDHLSYLLLPPASRENGTLLVGSDEWCGFASLDSKPGGFVELLQATWRALLVIYSDRCSIISGGQAGVPVTALLFFFCLILLVRVCLFGCMLACNAIMLQCHVKCLVASPSAGSSSVAVFAANFMCSVALSWLLLEEHLTFQFLAGAACMLSGVALLSLQKPSGVTECSRKTEF